MKKNIEIPVIKTKQEQIDESINNQLNEYRIKKHLYENPTRHFEIGHKWYKEGGYYEHEKHNTEVIEIYDDGSFYKVHQWGISSNYGRPSNYDNYRILPWTYLYDEFKIKKDNFSPKERQRIEYFQGHLQTILHNHYQTGINYSPEYQREFVWDLNDKQSLIDSIFNEVDIGKFVFVELPLDKKTMDLYLLEVLDGKQRINTLKEFYEDRFSYKDVFFSELSERDKNYIMQYPISMANLHDIPLEKKVDIFIRINTAGKVMEQEHLDALREKYFHIQKKK